MSIETVSVDLRYGRLDNAEAAKLLLSGGPADWLARLPLRASGVARTGDSMLLTGGRESFYIADLDVEIAQAASIADPIIDTVQDGVILDVRPVVSADRRFVTLELRPTVAELQRPIRNFTTSLGVSGNSVTIQLPELDISRVRTSIPMPDGGTVLLGGMKVHESQDLRSGVPILNKLPIFSFFFERQGTFITNRKLLVLVKAEIVIPTEHEPTATEMGLDPTLQVSPR